VPKSVKESRCRGVAACLVPFCHVVMLPPLLFNCVVIILWCSGYSFWCLECEAMVSSNLPWVRHRISPYYKLLCIATSFWLKLSTQLL